MEKNLQYFITKANTSSSREHFAQAKFAYTGSGDASGKAALFFPDPRTLSLPLADGGDDGVL